MPPNTPEAPPRFDHGQFLLHYNRGREAFQEGRYGEARRELEGAQRMRPDDPDVLNLLGLVYFKTSAFPEAEVIYRRLANENDNVFILHSNLGLILFKQGKRDEAEKHLLKAIELRPNYSKSHLYLGLLYKQRKKYDLALEHLQFAGAEKAVREVETEMRGGARPPAPPPQAPTPPPQAPAPKAQPQDLRTRPVPAPPSAAAAKSAAPVPPPPSAPPPSGHTAARKLQEAVDETQSSEDRRLDLGRKIEGASRTFALHENGFL
ncbi:MAG TPA: tetratricopeptide repeat protein, partial [Thermoanaerobaculia bacterium]